MAKKKTEEKTVHRPADPNVMGLRGTVVEQPILPYFKLAKG